MYAILLFTTVAIRFCFLFKYAVIFVFCTARLAVVLTHIALCTFCGNDVLCVYYGNKPFFFFIQCCSGFVSVPDITVLFRIFFLDFAFKLLFKIRHRNECRVQVLANACYAIN